MRIKNNFNKNSINYDQHAGIQKITAEDLISFLPGKSYSDILELGSGTGILTEKLIRKYPQSKIIALDSSENMIKTAKQKIVSPQVTFISDDIMSYSPTTKFELIIANAVLHWLGDLEAFIKKYRRQLKFRGRMAFSIFGPKTFNELGFCLKQMGVFEPITSENFFHKDFIRSEFSKFGFSATIEEVLYNIEVADLMALLRGIKYTGTRGLGLESKNIWTRNFINELEKIYLEKFGKIKVTYQVFYFIVSLKYI